jgi:WhiB family redox-sensing transcriptional regulator
MTAIPMPAIPMPAGPVDEVRIPRRIAARYWREFAACRTLDPDLFFPISSLGKSLEQVTRAKAVCVQCPVRRECLAFALRTHQTYGIWGGMTEEERRPESAA